MASDKQSNKNKIRYLIMAYVLRPHKGNDNLDGWDDCEENGDGGVLLCEEKAHMIEHKCLADI